MTSFYIADMGKTFFISRLTIDNIRGFCFDSHSTFWKFRTLYKHGHVRHNERNKAQSGTAEATSSLSYWRGWTVEECITRPGCKDGGDSEHKASNQRTHLLNRLLS